LYDEDEDFIEFVGSVIFGFINDLLIYELN